MASFYTRPNSPYFWIKYRRADGTWHAKSSGQRVDSKLGRRRVAKQVMELTAKEKLAKVEHGSAFVAWVSRWMDYQYSNPGTLERYRNAWAALLEFFEAKSIQHPGQVSYQVCHEYLRWRTDRDGAEADGRRASAWNTALMEVRVLGAVMQEAVRREYIMANPTARLGARRQLAKQKPEITPEEIERVEVALKKKPQWMRDSWTVYMRQGCRMSEAAVPLEKIDEKAGTITFKVKGGRMHSTAMHKDVAAIARRRRKQGRKLLVDLPRAPSLIWRKFFAKEVGLDGVTIHCTRVTVITRLARAGLPEVQTKAFIGHCSDEVHAIYRRFNASDLAHVAEALG